MYINLKADYLFLEIYIGAIGTWGRNVFSAGLGSIIIVIVINYN